jgi:hypothetical protein
MTDHATIAATFQRQEDAAGGYAAPDADAETICRRVAEELRIPYEDVRAVMLDMWTGQGAG